MNPLLAVSGALIALGLAALVFRQGLIRQLLGGQVLLAGINLLLLTFARERADLDGQVVAFFVLWLAALHLLVGTGLILGLFRRNRSVHVDQVDDATRDDFREASQ